MAEEDGLETAAAGPARPLLRGMLHAVAFAVAVVLGLVVVLEADGALRITAAAVFAFSVAAMLGVSALYHRVTWEPAMRQWMRRADHAGIYLLIAGTYTPVGLLILDGAMQKVVLAIVWGGAFAATLLKLFWVRAPKWLSVVIAIALGWVGVVAMPELLHAVGATPVALLAAGGVAYTLGGIVYACRRPRLAPRVFGYHELFHALTIVALAFQYSAIAFFVIRPS
jgi:hemolysin III